MLAQWAFVETPELTSNLLYIWVPGVFAKKPTAVVQAIGLLHNHLVSDCKCSSPLVQACMYVFCLT